MCLAKYGSRTILRLMKTYPRQNWMVSPGMATIRLSAYSLLPSLTRTMSPLRKGVEMGAV